MSAHYLIVILGGFALGYLSSIRALLRSIEARCIEINRKMGP